MQSASNKADKSAIAQTSQVLTVQPVHVQESGFLPMVGKALHLRIEGLKALNQKKEVLDDFTKRLENVENFKEKNVLNSLVLSVSNGDENLQFSNQSLIMLFLELAIKEGKDYKEKAELEFLNVEL